MRKYRKKPTGLVVEAAQIGTDDINEIAGWAHAFVVEEKDALTHETLEALNVRTAEGMVRASNGMYVVKVNGHIFVAKRDSFEAKYEPLEPELPEEIKENNITVSPELFRDYGGPRQI